MLILSARKTTPAKAIAQQMELLGYKKSDLIDGIPVSKYMLSKAMNGHLVKPDSGYLLKIFNFLGLSTYPPYLPLTKKGSENSPELHPEKNEIIMQALKEVWDGSQESAYAIARLLKIANSMPDTRRLE